MSAVIFLFRSDGEIEHFPVCFLVFRIGQPVNGELACLTGQLRILVLLHCKTSVDRLDPSRRFLEGQVPADVLCLEIAPRRPVADDQRTTGRKSLDKDVAEILTQCGQNKEMIFAKRFWYFLVKNRPFCLDRYILW